MSRTRAAGTLGEGQDQRQAVRFARTSNTRTRRLITAELGGWRCYLCRGDIGQDLPSEHPASLSIDHVRPLIAGGTDDESNRRAAHLRCNVAKGARTPAEYFASVGGRPSPLNLPTDAERAAALAELETWAAAEVARWRAGGSTRSDLAGVPIDAGLVRAAYLAGVAPAAIARAAGGVSAGRVHRIILDLLPGADGAGLDRHQAERAEVAAAAYRSSLVAAWSERTASRLEAAQAIRAATSAGVPMVRVAALAGVGLPAVRQLALRAER